MAAAPEFVYVPQPPSGESPFILHVGSCIARKRVDVLLKVFARLRVRDLRLVQVGGSFSGEQEDLIAQLGIRGRVTQLRNVTREEIAQLYRTAALVLQPSEAEGFGLPVVEALACGAKVLASDIPVLREGGRRSVGVRAGG